MGLKVSTNKLCLRTKDIINMVADDDERCISIARIGDIAAMKTAIEKGVKLDENTMATAVRNDNFELVKYLHDQGCPGNKWACRYAAKLSDIKILKFLHEHNYPWGVDTCWTAAFHGNLEALKYAYENGCPWNHKVIIYATLFKHEHILQYAIEKNCSINKDSYAADMKFAYSIYKKIIESD